MCASSSRCCHRHLPGPSASSSPAPASWVDASMRWVLVHVIEETGRHAGHADILREQITAPPVADHRSRQIRMSLVRH
ncbi:MAG TPA: DUF664 domain-containing protein [Actinophytocola sp.]|nr:DUF664 domain-containing protein [Actinophytocola sp.]